MKKIMSGILAGAMILSSIPAMAADINITIDNEEFIPKNALGEIVEPFIENGSTYLPVRAMGEAIGKTVKFDAENYAVYIGEEPDEETAKREAVLYADGIVLYEDTKLTFSDADFTFLAKVVKLAEEKIGKANIEQRKKELAAELSQEVSQAFSEMRYVLEDYLYVISCADLLEENAMANVSEEMYDDFVTVKHILVDDKAVADEIIKKIEAGENFDTLIEQYNIDPGQTKDSTYTFTYGEMVEEFEKVAFDLEENSYTKEPVATVYGYHIINKLPLDKESADIAPIVTEKLTEEVESVEFKKLVEVNKKGAYGEIEGFVLTTEDLEKVGGEDTPYSEAFSLLEDLVRVKTFFIQENMLSDEEKAVIEKTAEEYKESFAIINDEGKAAFLAELTGYYAIFIDKYYTGEITNELYEKINLIEIDSTVYKELKVFVDGKLIVPSDVNSNYVAPKNVDGTVYVPVRAIVEALGMKADWNNDTRTVMITK